MRRHLARRAPSARGSAAQPEDVIRLFAQHLTRGDLGALMGLYEPDAIYMSSSGTQLRSHEIHEFFAGMTALQPRMSGEAERVVTCTEIALVNNRWSLSYRERDGTLGRNGGVSVLVLRRRLDRTWGVVIDDPWGAGRPV